MIFIDGIGIGPRDPESNPLACFNGQVLRFFSDADQRLPNNGICIPTDACLGVEGVPQSATGQTTLFTGINAAAEVGRHVQGYPSGPLREIIASHSIFKSLKTRSRRVTFANAYTPRFFEQPPRWTSATTQMCESAGVTLRNLEDLEKGKALFMDFSNRILLDWGFSIQTNSPGQAAEILVALSQDYDLCLYEFFLTDLVGHRGDLREAVSLLEEVDEFLGAVLSKMSSGSLIIVSDHGNIEDMRHGLHTRNPVPTLVWGSIRAAFPQPFEAMSLADIAPSIKNHLNGSL